MTKKATDLEDLLWLLFIHVPPTFNRDAAEGQSPAEKDEDSDKEFQPEEGDDEFQPEEFQPEELQPEEEDEEVGGVDLVLVERGGDESLCDVFVLFCFVLFVWRF